MLVLRTYVRELFWQKQGQNYSLHHPLCEFFNGTVLKIDEALLGTYLIEAWWDAEFKVNNSTSKAGFEVEAVDQKYKRVKKLYRSEKSEPHRLKISRS